MVARARKHNESYKEYRRALVDESREEARQRDMFTGWASHQRGTFYAGRNRAKAGCTDDPTYTKDARYAK